jgi:hypothetical protein
MMEIRFLHSARRSMVCIRQRRPPYQITPTHFQGIEVAEIHLACNVWKT